VLLVACGSSSAGVTVTKRPTTSATLEILSPQPNDTTDPVVDLRLALHGAKVVAPSKTTGALRGDEGHVHVSVDGKLVTMTYGLEQEMPALKPGTHTIQAEFVATDHRPFANRVAAVVQFQVR
jgi:hypothetical protein